MHLHLGLAAGAAMFATVLFFGTLWRILATTLLRGTSWGEAMIFMY